MIDDFSRAVEMSPTDQTAFSVVPVDLWKNVPATVRERWYKIAESAAERLLDRVEGLNCLGGMYSRYREWDRAQDAFERALPVGGESSGSLMRNWARMLSAQGRLPEALQKYRRAVELRQSDWVLVQELAGVELASGRVDDGRQHLVAARMAGAIANSQDSYELALSWLARPEDLSQYRAACRDMVAKYSDSRDPDELVLTAWTAAILPKSLDDYGSAITLARRSVELNKDSAEAVRSLGAILYRAGKYDESVQQLAPLVADAENANTQAKTSPAYPHFFLAMAQHQLGKQDEARGTLEKAIKLVEAELADKEHAPKWNRKLTLELLRTEAESLIGRVPPVSNPPAPEDSGQSSLE
jgi:tetratricopeptide (TPR) repeat protein